MSKNLKLTLGSIYLAILIIFLYFLFSKFDFSRINDFSYYKILQADIDQIIGTNLKFNLILFFIFSFTWVVLLGFGSPILLLSGILFGKWFGTIISVTAISLGALILYSIGSFFFRDLVKSILEKKFIKYIHLFQKNELYYFFIYRFSGGLGIPFGLQNLIPILFGMKKINYFFSSFFGFFPGFFIINTIGAGLNSYIAQAENFNMIDLIFTPGIYLPILMFLVLMFISLLIKKKFFDGRN